MKYHTQTLRFTDLSPHSLTCTRRSATPVTEQPAYPPHHTHITPVTLQHSHGLHRASHLTAQSRITLQAVDSFQLGAASAHAVWHPKNYTHAETQLILSRRRSRSRNPHSGKHTHTRTHAHEAGYIGTHACEPRAGTTSREESDRIRLTCARPQGGTTDALGCQDSGLHCLEVRRGSHSRDCSRLSSVSSPREYAGTRVRDQSRPVRACLRLRLRTQSPSPPGPAVDYISQKPQGEGVNFHPEGSPPGFLGCPATAGELVEAGGEVGAR